MDDLNRLRTPDEEKQVAVSKLVDRFVSLFEEVQCFYIEKIASQIKTIEGLNATSINRLSIMARMNEDIAQIKKKLAKALAYSKKYLDQMLLESFKEVSGPDIFKERVSEEKPQTESARKSVEQLAKSIARQTNGTLENLSNTTVITKNYSQMVDRAIIATTSGLSSYTETARQIVKDLGSNGLKIEYASGYKQRLDSAVRSNIVSACNQIAQQGSDIVAEKLGCDCKEITVHSCPAPDHAPVQGHVLKNEEWDKMQAGESFKDINGAAFMGFRRPIGEWNCMHFGMAFNSRYQKPKYTQEQLNEILRKNKEGFVWNGKHYTMYEGTQLMRQLELKVRKQMDIAIGAKAAGLEDMQAACQTKIDSFGKMYTSLSEASGIPKQMDRMRVEGFARWKFSEDKGSKTSKPTPEEPKRLNYHQPLRDFVKDNPNALKVKARQKAHLTGSVAEGKSELKLTMEQCQEIIYNKSGKGTLVFDKKGKWLNKERVLLDDEVGLMRYKDGSIEPTRGAMIHYGKDGAHLVPRKADPYELQQSF